MIHPSAIIDEGARLAPGVSVGPWSIIGADVEIGENTRIDAHVVINGPTRIGRDNHIYPFNALGDAPQDKKYAGEKSRLEIGDGNTIREFCTFNRGTDDGGGLTRIGDDNWIMAYVHIAHDCELGNHTILANGSTLAGHVRVEDHVILGAFTVVHQFCAIGAHSFSAMSTVILKDVPPYVTVSGNSASPHGLNGEGLKRRGFTTHSLLQLKRAYKVLYKQRLTVEQALRELRVMASECDEIVPLVAFLENSSRGIVR